MESLSIRTTRGGSLLNGLGNASPRHLEVTYRGTHLDMDLGGRWVADAEIEIHGGMGGGVVHLPSGVMRLDRRTVAIGGAPPTGT
jgi:hypothetical protein